ncbi:hypothetical protein [Rhodopirellula sallentina]|uniref:hypothetical protein n=1 Tax=Rhodopirellula sallentina TaxID=1263869 RepID=UPI0009DACAC9|nr:hypothetical protein [Rhodopirellula sallentina]
MSEDSKPPRSTPDSNRPLERDASPGTCLSDPACPVCGGRLIDIRGKLQCTACHRICETCCEGGRG